MSNEPVPKLTFRDLQDAVAGTAAAFRCVTRLEPAGGPDDKVFPPTYAGGVYAVEERRIRNGDGKEQVVRCVLLDSVQSQANRMEEALLRGNETKQLRFPLLVVDFRKKEDGKDQDDLEIVSIGRISTLDAPHRIADAIFRDSVVPKGTDFRGVVMDERRGFRESPLGTAFENANVRRATALFELCPTALVFGTWDSTGSRGGLGNKFARTIASEVVGIDATVGVRTSSRIDPLGIGICDLYESNEGGWTVHPEKAKTAEDGNPLKFTTKAGKGNPSAINHGNITPDFARYGSGDVTTVNRQTPDPLRPGRTIEAGAFKPGGVTISYALQTTVLSLAGLRRLRFPNQKGETTPERDSAARTVLAALALAAVVYQRLGGYDLRSRCLLVPAEEASPIELIHSASNRQTFTLTPEEACVLFSQAVDAVKGAGLPWREEEVLLWPRDRLVDLVREGRQAAAQVGEG